LAATSSIEANFNSTVATLSTAASSTNANIANASRALTSSTETGFNYETEVLATLVGHDARLGTIQSNLVAGDAATLASANTFTTSAVAAEAALRITADNALGARITAEENARIAADNALGGRITAETNARIAADNAMRDMIASSTATAIALGGSTILPDTNFTLSGNVGLYEGATAIAINAAARISEKAYVTAAVGGGTNKNGKLGGRVGVVFGF
jgi:hypothetical protein